MAMVWECGSGGGHEEQVDENERIRLNLLRRRELKKKGVHQTIRTGAPPPQTHLLHHCN